MSFECVLATVVGALFAAPVLKAAFAISVVAFGVGWLLVILVRKSLNSARKVFSKPLSMLERSAKIVSSSVYPFCASDDEDFINSSDKFSRWVEWEI